jgi:hypothetical protein
MAQVVVVKKPFLSFKEGDELIFDGVHFGTEDRSIRFQLTMLDRFPQVFQMEDQETRLLNSVKRLSKALSEILTINTRAQRHTNEGKPTVSEIMQCMDRAAGVLKKYGRK